MILELMHAFMRETDEGLTLKQVFKRFSFHFVFFVLLLLTARHHSRNLDMCRKFAISGIFTQFWKVEA